MKNLAVGRQEAEDIERQVQRILKGLGNPEPPLNLNSVRQLLKLDKEFYSSSKDSGRFREVVSRFIVAGKQIFKKPMVLWDAIVKADLSALYLPSKRLILIDTDKPRIKHRWNESHEIAHSFIEWHATPLTFRSFENDLDAAAWFAVEARWNKPHAPERSSGCRIKIKVVRRRRCSPGW